MRPTKKIKPTERENVHFANEDIFKISRLAGEPLSNHVMIEKTQGQDMNEDDTANIYLQKKEGLMSLLFNNPDKPQ